ncbi:hypothetical protein [Kordiimonas sp.]|uniref:hypothetical protein n=1 Tax=Kordiimonas sp. TaxID=1970157 RepID=UPI003A94E93F
MTTDTDPTYSLDDLIVREREDEDYLVSCVANLQEAADAYQEAETALEGEVPDAALGTKEEIASALETARRSLHYALEELNEEDISRALEQGLMAEGEAAFALKHKRFMELEEMREQRDRGREINRDDLER